MDLNARQDSVEALRRRARMSGQRLLETGPPIAEQLTFDNRDNPDRLRGATVATHYITYRDRFRTRHEHSMRAFYSTQKHIRVFILGTPEGWQVSIYDLLKHEWVEKDGRIEAMLKTAKATAQEKTSILLGKTAPELKWH